ncbi:transglutaminase domain-containing protein [Flavobacterium sp. 3HN19-14]|uniref:transglutaminase domain-containing protein n=1 Tax=Flavobacterium sp. 3HN19-14 TaxID=3448133 RepID=UPI003EE35968
MNYSEFKVATPEYYTYNAAFKGFIIPVTTKTTASRSYTTTSKERTGNRVVKTNFTTDKTDYRENIITYVEKDLPSMKDENFVNNIDNYTSSVSHELAMVKWPDSPMKMLSTDWESVTKSIYDRDDFGPELNKTGYFEDDIKALTAGLSSDNEKVAAIFNFVKSSVKWDGFYSYGCNEGVRRAYKDKTGNVAEINLMLTAMLRNVGLTANPVLVSTRSNGIPLFPSRSAFNYVIAAVELPGSVVLLDATEKYSLPGILPVRDLNWFGRLIRKDGTSAEINLIPDMQSREVVNMMFTIRPDGEINGKIRNQFSDQNALYFRQKNVGLTQDSYLEKLENNNNKIEVSDYVRENELDLSKPVVESFSFKETKASEVIGDKIYFSPLLFLTDSENPFKQETREYPVDFGYPTQYKYNVSIEIPEGYAIESLPQQTSIGTENKMSAFKYTIANTGNKIQLAIVNDMNEAIVPSENYQMLKDFYQKMIDKLKEKIVLKKV